MDKQTTLAFVLIGAVLVVWLFLNAPDPTEQQGSEKDSIGVAEDTFKTPDETAPIKNIPKESLETATVEPGKIEPNDVLTDTTDAGNIITVENDVVIIELSTKGGNIHKVYLKKFNNWYSRGENGENYYKNSVQLINYSLGSAYDLSFVTTDGKAVSTGDYIFEADTKQSKLLLSNKDSLVITFTLTFAEGRYIEKEYIFYKDSYQFNSNIDLVGMNNMISNSTYDVVWGTGIRGVEENSVNEANYSNVSVYYGDEQVIIDASSLDEGEAEDFNGRIDWVAVRNKYFAAIMIPNNPSDVEGAYLEGYREPLENMGIKEIYSARITVPFKNTNHEKQSFTIYIGPVDYDGLKNMGSNLEALVDFGSFFGLKFIVRPIAEFILLPLFNFIHNFIPNFGFVIIVFSIIIKIVLYPLTKKSYQSMKKMQLLQPKIAEIKEKYKEDAQKMNKETMKLYKVYGVNPAGGCMPLLLQMPIFVALWGLFQTAIELRQQPFILWIKDLSNPDVIYDLGFKLPLFGIQEISGLALLMGITTFFQQKMTMKDPKQKQLVYIMPVMLTILFMTFPSGLNLYYFMFNVFSIAQQYYINHKHDGMVLEPVKDADKKPGFMSRLMEAAEKQSQSQQKKRR
ncbi:MAG: membrane protein insertase YidC [Ignavibacteriaceae bacterium]|nr:membrane protein insertase YidC [Ignavibacteriaceae bacterium]